jgi:prepilin-type processing-associated H-X9-DG protein
MVRPPSQNANDTASFPFYYLEGFDGTFGENAGNGTRNSGSLRTFLGYDFSKPPDQGTYEYPNLEFNLARPVAYGPSSAHPSVVNVLMCDGSVQAISKNIDANAFFFAITRNNGDTFNLY